MDTGVFTLTSKGRQLAQMLKHNHPPDDVQ
jgi:hypothetical protein